MRKKLKLFRVENDLTQAQMAKKIGVSTHCYNQIEIGKREGSLAFVRKLKQAFGLSGDEVLEMMEDETVREKNHSEVG